MTEPKILTHAEVKKQCAEGKCLMIIHDKVYDLTDFTDEVIVKCMILI